MRHRASSDWINGHTSVKKRKRKPIFIYIIGIAVIVLFIYTIRAEIVKAGKAPTPDSNSSRSTATVAVDAATSISNPPFISPGNTITPVSSSSAGLGQTVENSLSGTTGNYGVVVENLKTGENYYLNEHRSFDSGSLYKLWVMAVTYQQIQSKLLNPNEKLSKSISDLDNEFNVTSDDIDSTENTVTYSVNDALYQMITISDNAAALLLTDRIKESSITSFLQAQGLNQSTIGDDGQAPVTTASDVAKFFEKLYRGALGDSQSTDAMLTLLKQQKLNDKIPKYLPEGVVVAHKTGELNQFTHDAGIIYAPTGEYLLVVLSESDNPPLAEERISEVSKEVYNYFTTEGN